MSAGNIVHTKGHHTCNAGHRAYIQSKAPFKSVYSKAEGRMPYLGDGYYLWDDKIDTAKWWGQVHYRGDYSIVELDLKLHGEHFLDLVGSREDIRNFSELINSVAAKLGRNSVSECVYVLRQLERECKGAFPYRVIRALDSSAIKQNQCLPFKPYDRHYLNLNPRYIICFYRREDLPLHTLRIIR